MPDKITTVGRELVRNALPEQYRKYADGVLSKGALSKLMTDIGLNDKDSYIDVLQRLNGIGQSVVSTYGKDTALPFADVMTGKATVALNRQLRQLTQAVLADRTLTNEQKEERIKQIGYKYSQKVQDAVFADNDARHTALASQINSGSRGNKTQLMQLQFGNMMMVDALNRDLPYLHTDPYVNGTSPMAYWVSASSGRKGYYDVQAATGQSGYLGKQVTAATHGNIIEAEDCGTKDTGVAFDATDTKNVGAVLLRPFHKYPAGTVVTEKMVDEAEDGEEMICRSPLTCRCRFGVCQKCNGLGENGKFPAIGEYVSLNAARTFVETMTQGAIGCLHPETEVRMADGSACMLKDIKEGDEVLGFTLDGKAEPAKVLKVMRNGEKPVYIYNLAAGGSLRCTEDHRFLQDEQGVYSMKRIADASYVCRYDRYIAKYVIRSADYIGVMPVMDLEVDNDSHWYILANGVVTHNSKHKGGVGGKKVEDPDGEDQPTGFPKLEQFLMAPSTFKGAAVLAPADGTVSGVREAPQGGWYISVGDQTLYANPYRTVKVKAGDRVYAGDVLTNGVPNPVDVVQLKGLGSGRKYFMSKLADTLGSLGWGTDRRNLESFARSLVSKVRITDPDGFKDYLPGEVADYNEITADWTPREGSVTGPVDKAVNQYLEKPVLNYSIGTRVTPEVADDLKRHGFDTVTSNAKEMPFSSQFMRPAALLQNDSRWLPRLSGERLYDSMFAATRKGMTDSYDSTSYIDKIIIEPFRPN